MRIEEIISEGRDSPLYHNISLINQKFSSITQRDYMPATWTHKIPEIGGVKGNSFTRNPRLKWNSIQFKVNQSLLSRTNKIIPLDGDYVFSNGVSKSRELRGDKDSRYLAEEFVVGDIKNFHRYVSSVNMVTIVYIGNESLTEHYKKLFLMLFDWSYKYDILLLIPHAANFITHGRVIRQTSYKGMFTDSELQNRYPNGLNLQYTSELVDLDY